MKMVEMKTAELIGPSLNWAAAEALGGERKPYRFASNEDAPMDMAWVFPYGYACTRWAPSTEWSQGGPLIDKHKIDLHFDGRAWWAQAGTVAAGPLACRHESVLIAACRAIVAAKLGDVVSVPAELVNGGGV